MKVGEILKVTGGRLISGDRGIDIDTSSISTDSRTVKVGEFFIALKGPNFDGDDFVEEAFKKGAISALVTKRRPPANSSGHIVIQVSDTTKAMQDLARYHRTKFKIPVIGVTGSNGKTTTKDMVWGVLSKKYNVLKNEGTKNNHIGVPLTILKLNASHDICVLEIGMNHKGEIRFLSNIAKPSVAIITNIGPSHLEFFRNLNDVLKAKKEILESLDRGDVAILNGDSQFLSGVKNDRFDILRFGFKKINDFRAENVSVRENRIEFLLNGKKQFVLNLLGVHNIYNALAAITIASLFDVGYESVRKSLADYKATYMRLNLKKMKGLSIIDDSYNSNPSSMSCALETLCNYPARARWIVSGDMLELGKDGKYFHQKLGEDIARSGAAGLITFGKLSMITLSRARSCGMGEENSWHCATHGNIAKILKKVARKGDAVLIKGSRAMRMEEVIKKL